MEWNVSSEITQETEIVKKKGFYKDLQAEQ